MCYLFSMNFDVSDFQTTTEQKKLIKNLKNLLKVCKHVAQLSDEKVYLIKIPKKLYLNIFKVQSKIYSTYSIN